MVKLVFPNATGVYRSGAESLRALFQSIASWVEKSPDAKPVIATQVAALIDAMAVGSTKVNFPSVAKPYRGMVGMYRDEFRLIAQHARRAPGFQAVFTTQVQPLLAVIGDMPSALRAVGTRAEQHYFRSGALTTTNQRVLMRSRHYIAEASGARSMQFVDNNYHLADADANGDIIETPNLNPVTMRRAVEYNGQVVQVRWGGQTSIVIQPGTIVESDPVLPSAFGLTTFPAGAEFFLRTEKVAAVGQNHLWYRNTADSPAVPGDTCLRGTVGAPDLLMNTGVPQAAGDWQLLAVSFLPAAIVGDPVIRGKAMGCIGASIEAGPLTTALGSGDGVNGSGGYIRQSFGKRYAYVNMQRGGESARSYLNNSTLRKQMYKYCDIILCGHGGNDYSGGLTLSSTQDRFRQIWAVMKGEGKKVYQIGLSPKTDSTDSWATVANQTPRPNFQIGGTWRDPMHTYLTSVSGTLIDGWINMDNSQVDATARDKWRLDLGVPTTDGIHPLANVHGAMTTQLTGILAGITA